MAVTQQIIRLKAGDLLACSNCEDHLNKLISFDLNLPEDAIDLNWAPRELILYCKLSKQTSKVQHALGMALDSTRLVNEQCRDTANDYQVYSDITMLLPDEVKSVSEDLKSINWYSFETCIPTEQDGLACPPSDYYTPKMHELVDFISGAAENNLGIAQWWD